MRRFLLSFALLAAALGGVSAFADESAESLERARQLVGQLSSPSFTEREQAAQQLARLGEAARPALQEALKLPEAETRLRVQRILSQIEQNDFQRQIDAFLADAEAQKTSARDYNLPGWPRFRELIGDGLAARKMFVRMLKAEGALLSAASNNPRGAAGTFQMRCQQLQAESSSQGEEIDAASLAAVLFVASNDRVPMPNGTDSLLYRFCSHSSVKKVLENKGDTSMMRQIVGAWIASGRGGYYSLRLAMQHELPEGLSAAEKMLDGDTPAYYRQYAILTYAKLGDREHIPRLMKLLTDTTVCTTHRVNNETFQTQFRDIALVAILHLLGHDPRMYGFERIREHSQYVYSPYTLGFKDEDDRADAFAQWEKLKEQLDLE